MSLLRDLTVDALVSRLVAILFFGAVLGFITSLLAWLLGDRRSQFSRRLTINPFSHVSASGALVAAVFGVGWIRNVPFDARQNRWGAIGVLLVSLAGLFLTALTIPLVDSLRSLAVNVLPQTGGYAVVYTLIQYQEVTLASCLLNLLPLPGLVCGAIWPAIWPGREKRISQLEPIALAAVTAIIVSGVIGNSVPSWLRYFSTLT
jgi:Zn-dependent protease